jgi:LL-diaminopimelate aminotransferase
VFESCAVVLAPGAAYGANGEGFVRFSLTVEDDRLDEAISRMRAKLGTLQFD